jgi:hypothetical protein
MGEMAAMIVDLGDLGLDRGGTLLVKRAMAQLAPGESLAVAGRDPALATQLRAWCREKGHPLTAVDPSIGSSIGASPSGAPASASASGAPIIGQLRERPAGRSRAEPTGGTNTGADAVVDAPPQTWGLAMRGALVESGGPRFHFPLATKDEVWSDDAGRIYAQAVAAQWNPDTAVDWQAPLDHPAEIEAAVVQIMTYLVENETAALLVPARFLAQIHPHFREVLQVLAVQVADEARHIEVFTRRAQMGAGAGSGAEHRPGLSTVGGQASLKTLLDEPDFALASFMLTVLGEGTFLSLLQFLHDHAPDPITRQIMRLAHQDEARHVAFGVAHLRRHAGRNARLRERLALAVQRRHSTLQHTAGLNEEVFDALVLLAAGSWEPQAIGRGFDRVQALQADMDSGRRRRLEGLGFGAQEAADLSALHTRNFM